MNSIMVPGLLCDAESWAHQTRILADIADCRVATVTGAATVEECGRLSAMEQTQAVTALLRQWLLYD